MTDAFAFVKLRKSIIFNPIFKDEKMLKFYIWLLCKAAYKKDTRPVGKKQVNLKPGQVIFGLDSAEKELGITKQILRRIIRTLISTRDITYSKTPSYSIITVLDNGVFDIFGGTDNTLKNRVLNIIKNNNRERNKKKNERYGFGVNCEEHNYAGYDLELYEKMLNEDLL